MSLPSGHPYKINPPYGLNVSTARWYVDYEARWTPAEISTLAWYDASDLSTITEGNPGKVTEWDDKSGNGYNLIQTVENNQPSLGGSINGVHAIDFVDGASALTDWMYVNGQFPNSNADFDWVVALVGELTAPPALRNVLTSRDVGGGDDYTIQYRGDVNPDRWQNNCYSDGSDVLSNTGASNCLYSDGGGIVVRSNLNISPASTGIQVGRDVASRGWGGAIGEIICGTGTLDSDTKDKIEGYLAWKWGIQSKLPPNHVYKFQPPTL